MKEELVTSPSPRPRVLSRRKLLLTGHVAVSVGLIGAAMVLLALGVAGLRGADPRTVYPAAHLVEAWVVAPLAVLALGSGVAQAVLMRWGLTTYWWVTTKLAITAVTVVVVIFVLDPRLGASAAAAAAGHTFTTAERLPLVIAPAIAVALLVLNVGLGVYKPSRRLRSHTKESA
jgi:hypothetical protein